MTFNLNREEYLNRIDGIVYGDDPRQGYVKDNVFYHPGMAFQFPIPTGWAVSNMPAEVRMAPENQSALLVFTTAPGTDISTVSAAFAKQNNVTVTSSTNITINGMSGVKTVGQMPMENQTAGIASYYILKDTSVFIFHGLSSTQQFSANDTLFNGSATGFNRISDRSRLDVSPKHITVRRTASAGTLRSALNGFGVPENEIDNLAIINALDLDSAVPAGVRLKVIAET
jgi:predicted Zn-dependent protease